MAKWKEVSRSTNILGIRSTIGDLELRPGDKMRIIMELKVPMGWLFDVGGIELIMQPFVPDGMNLVDVYGEGSEAYVDMEVPSINNDFRIAGSVGFLGIGLVAALAFLKVHWVALAILGVAITTILAVIIILIKIAIAPALPIATMAIAGAVVLGIIVLNQYAPPRKIP